MGEGIQKNREQIKGHKFFVFDMYDIDEKRYLSPQERYDFLEILTDQYDVSIAHVPWIADIDIKDFNSVQEFLEFAERPSLKHPIAEGVVFKSHEGNVSFKAISNRYLLKCEE